MGGSGSSRGGELRQLQLGGPGASGALIGRGKKEAPAQLGRQGGAMAKELEPKEGPGPRLWRTTQVVLGALAK